ncbi:hypothetical protein KDX38_10755 [Pseudomonas sp. CDFA 602]|uniref:hypothetical protein n=1 Tax=Pseudomonas californiensis TaxID=2829823 RepID=UPI001E3766D3|nr:hypothetical protein [Pseudomonas californiensis]MCD5994203.1 hypothetical protein [Pseudomonas californiensis]MCD5999698.1 hypothetical protein [Pseudomonas californiensis]
MGRPGFLGEVLQAQGIFLRWRKNLPIQAYGETMTPISEMGLPEVTQAILKAAVNIPDGLYARAQYLAKVAKPVFHYSGKYAEVLKPFLAMMEKELHANSNKGDRPGWLSMSADTCLLEIYYHLGKLQRSVKDGDSDGICEYAADVANLSMMLTDICGALALFAAGQPADQQGEPVGYSTYRNGRYGTYLHPSREMAASHDSTAINCKPACSEIVALYRHAQPATAKVDERAEFEKWVLSNYPSQHMGRFATGEYHSTVIEDCWVAWQARAKLNGIEP